MNECSDKRGFAASPASPMSSLSNFTIGTRTEPRLRPLLKWSQREEGRHPCAAHWLCHPAFLPAYSFRLELPPGLARSKMSLTGNCASRDGRPRTRAMSSMCKPSLASTSQMCKFSLKCNCSHYISPSLKMIQFSPELLDLWWCLKMASCLLILMALTVVCATEWTEQWMSSTTKIYWLNSIIKEPILTT